MIFMIYLQVTFSFDGLGALLVLRIRNYLQGSKPVPANIFFLRTNI